jgi:hypothetical protein
MAMTLTAVIPAAPITFSSSSRVYRGSTGCQREHSANGRHSVAIGRIVEVPRCCRDCRPLRTTRRQDDQRDDERDPLTLPARGSPTATSGPEDRRE